MQAVPFPVAFSACLLPSQRTKRTGDSRMTPDDHRQKQYVNRMDSQSNLLIGVDGIKHHLPFAQLYLLMKSFWHSDYPSALTRLLNDLSLGIFLPLRDAPFHVYGYASVTEKHLACWMATIVAYIWRLMDKLSCIGE